MSKAQICFVEPHLLSSLRCEASVKKSAGDPYQDLSRVINLPLNSHGFSAERGGMGLT